MCLHHCYLNPKTYLLMIEELFIPPSLMISLTATRNLLFESVLGLQPNTFQALTLNHSFCWVVIGLRLSVTDLVA